METVLLYAIVIGVTVYSCILHEVAHVWSAYKLGDPTGKNLGRLTLDPRPHFSLFWTFLLPLWTYIFARFPVGGPKPAPINPLNFREPRTGMMLSGLAGPGMNVLLAAVALGLLWIFSRLPNDWIPPDSFIGFALCAIVFVNVGLAALNLIPIPPLDGSRFLQYILGRKGDAALEWIERLGPIPIFIAFYFLGAPVQRAVMVPLIELLVKVLGYEYSGPLLRTYFGQP
jgi:Zn-dependent protease